MDRPRVAHKALSEDDRPPKENAIQQAGRDQTLRADLPGGTSLHARPIKQLTLE